MNTGITRVRARREAHGMHSPIYGLKLADHTDPESNLQRVILAATGLSPQEVVGSVWKHAKTSTLYTVLGFWVEAGEDVDDALVHVVYRSMTDQLVWFRPAAEWTERVHDSPRFIAFGEDRLAEQLGSIKHTCLAPDKSTEGEQR